MFKTKQILGVTGAALTLSALALPSTAGIISVGTTAPTGDGADQFNLVARTAGASIFGDRPVQGQTFTTTADSGQELVSLTVSLRDNTGLVFDGWKDYLIRFGTITSGTLTPIHEEVIRQNDDLAASTDIYHTFTFDAPIALSASTTYAFDIGVAGSQNGWQSGIPSLATSGDSYAGGQRHQGAKTNAADTNYSTSNTSGDLIFHADITVVPEPGSLALLGLGGLLIARRRRA